MYKVKNSLKWFIDKMGKVVLHLLGTLYVHKFVAKRSQDVDLLIFKLLIFFNLLDLKTHVATHSTHSLVSHHIFIHFEQCIIFRSQADIQQHCVFRFQLPAEPIEEPIM